MTQVSAPAPVRSSWKLPVWERCERTLARDGPRTNAVCPVRRSVAAWALASGVGPPLRPPPGVTLTVDLKKETYRTCLSCVSPASRRAELATRPSVPVHRVIRSSRALCRVNVTRIPVLPTSLLHIAIYRTRSRVHDATLLRRRTATSGISGLRLAIGTARQGDGAPDLEGVCEQFEQRDLVAERRREALAFEAA